MATTPDAETRARRRLFNISRLPNEGPMLIDVDGKPILVFRRSPEELTTLEATHAGKAPASDWRNTPQRSPRAGIMAFIAKCTFDQCVVVMNTGTQGRFLICPCCASRFDLSARRLSGPAPTDLVVPEYRFISTGEIEFTPI
jgi:ubiquinol-cytochrome c reductase iron-sulfur subunit